ncbi:hypothetical protein Agub_g15790, partial [Astrephomene gubernaculifera]
MTHKGWRVEIALVLLLALAFAPHKSLASGHRGALEADVSELGVQPPQSITKLLPAGSARPFLALKDPANAASQDVQQLYVQGASAAAIAYLLFAAAEPLSEAEGSSPVLLPYLSPTTLRLYASRPERCGSDVVRGMYELSNSLYGSSSLQACHFALYRALQLTFAWVRDNIPLAPQQPLLPHSDPNPTSSPPPPSSSAAAAAAAAAAATALFPSLSEPDFTSALSAALADPQQLG